MPSLDPKVLTSMRLNLCNLCQNNHPRPDGTTKDLVQHRFKREDPELSDTLKWTNSILSVRAEITKYLQLLNSLNCDIKDNK